MFVIYTDGACSGNPGPGGWGARIEGPDGVDEISGGEQATTNNRMELSAAIEALTRLPDNSEVTLVTDSNYVKDGMTSWLPNWKKRDWKTAAKKPVKNVDLWKLLDTQCQRHRVQWQWVKGHSGHPGN